MAVRKKKTTRKVKVFPKTLGACIDKLYKQRAVRLKLQTQVENSKKDESALSKVIFRMLAKQRLDASRGKVGHFFRGTKRIGVIEDWRKVQRFIARKNAWDLLQRRLNTNAWLDRLDNKERVPGIKVESVLTYSLTKVGGK